MSQADENQDESNITLLPLKAKKIDLHNPSAIRREMADVYRAMRGGEMEPADGTKLVYTLDLLMKAYKTAVLDDRIQAVEMALKTRELK